MSATEWKFVPVEPTREMLVAALKTNGACPIYAAMLDAAPVPPSVESLLENWTPSDQKAFAKFRDEYFPGEMSSYAIQSLGSAWKDGQANASPEVRQYTGTGSDSLDCILGVGGFASFGPLDAQPAAHLTIPGALEWDGDNGTHGADGESRDNRDNKPEPTPVGEGTARLIHAYDLGEFADEGGSATVEAMSCESFDNSECSEHQFESYTAGYQRAIYEQAAPLLHEVGRIKSFRLAYMEWSDKTDWVQETAQPRELGKHRADVITERFKSLNAQLASTEQSRRSFFDLSQDLEKRLAERDALLLESSAWIKQNSFGGSDAVDLWERIDASAASAKCESCGDWGHIETEDSAHDCPECGPSVVERAVEAGVMNAPINRNSRCCCPPKGFSGAWAAGPCPEHHGLLRLSAVASKPKTCIECDQPYCHGVCVERGDQDYDRDQAAKGGDQ